jgi:hypothetical protein
MREFDIVSSFELFWKMRSFKSGGLLAAPDQALMNTKAIA